MVADQRYCLACGRRRGEPRLPFMDAAAYIEALDSPAPREAVAPPPRRRRISPNAALIAGVGTLILAMGLGVMIGRSGGEATTAETPPVQVVRVGGGATPTAARSRPGKAAGTPKAKASGSKGGSVAPEKDPTPAAEEVLKPTAGVDLPPPTVKPGGKCPAGSAGCDGGKFTGDFFGE